ncbi:MAG: hypothetical protein WC055_00105 [Melioribacteraceae bacterium]
MDKYILKIGDSVAARRKIKSTFSPNLIVGPIVDVGSANCRIITNPGTSAEEDFILNYSDWNFQFLHTIIK